MKSRIGESLYKGSPPVVEQLCFMGWLSRHSLGRSDSILFLSTKREPFLKVLQDRLSEKTATVRYWFTTLACSEDEYEDDRFVTQHFGKIDVRFGDHERFTLNESRSTRYNLLEKMNDNIGKWLRLEIYVHGNNAGAD